MTSDNHVYIGGLGIISAIGKNISETIQSFKEHRSGIHSTTYLETRHNHSFPLGEVKLSNSELAQLLNLSPKLSRTILLSYHAVLETLSHISMDKLQELNVGFISASTVGGMDKTETFFESYNQDPESGDLSQVIHHDNGKATDYVASKFGIHDFVTTLSTACSSSANAIMLGTRLIKANQLDVVIAGGVDALTRFTLNGFNSLMILDKNQCKPLDQGRQGLNLGEGAAYVLLLNEKALTFLGLSSSVIVSGYSNSNDSYHQTALSDDGQGPFLAMQGAIKKANIQPGQIDYINMHGTGTQNNDQAESQAVKNLFQDNIPPVSSTKSFTGHTLGASGAVEAVISVLAIQHHFIPPNYNFNSSIEPFHISPVTKIQENVKLTHVLSNSFGFGGNCSSLIFSSL